MKEDESLRVNCKVNRNCDIMFYIDGVADADSEFPVTTSKFYW